MTDEPLNLTPWIGSALRHVSAAVRQDVLDFHSAGIGPYNRWNAPGDRTLYLAGDPGVLVAEWGRHLTPRIPDPLAAEILAQRIVYQLRLKLDAVLDVRQSEVAAAIGLIDHPQAWLDMEVTRIAARVVRGTTRAQGMLVPSVAFLDDLTRWNLVVFLEKLPADTASWITEVKKVGPLRWQ